MKTFLQELAEAVRNEFPEWEKLTVVFPNRRAALYFKEELRKGLGASKWAPTIVTIEEFISSLSSLQVADKFNLILRLYHSYKQVNQNTEGIEKFYYWGEMLLRDFDELDKHLVDAESLFRDVGSLKEVEHYFDYLTEEQKSFLKDFWQSVEFSSAETKARFLSLWRSLLPVYKHFVNQLLLDGIGYEGLIHRKGWEKLSTEKPRVREGQVIFAGFYALTRVEENIISWFVQNQQAKVFWDEDDFYVSKDYREAADFFRLYRKHPILKQTFSKQPPKHLSSKKQITLVGVAQKTGQPKLLSQYLQELHEEDYEKTVVVLPDESMLLPVLYSLPTALRSFNVTMGYPLVASPFFSFVDFVFDLHRTKRGDEFYFRYVLKLLNHPYVKAIAPLQVGQLQDLIKKENRVYLDSNFFIESDLFIAAVFKSVNKGELVGHIMALIEELAVRPTTDLFEKEFAFYFHRQLAKLNELSEQEPMELAMAQKLFRQMMRSERVPFSGEPIKGIQIMGVLETRNLDFENVFVLSLNEGLWPASAKQGSYVPYSIRKAYGLPTYQQQDSMYAYLFYRLLQRTQNASLFYNTSADALGMGEMSRYLNQIIYDTGWPHERKILHGGVTIKQPQPIRILKDANVLAKLKRYEEQDLTPSSLNNYLECRLLFYFKNVIGLKEPNDVEETADARVFGNIFHEVMQCFYVDLKPVEGPWLVELTHYDDLDDKLTVLIERAYRKHFSIADHRAISYQGQQLVVNEMVKNLVKQVLEQDRIYAPFFIEMLEAIDFNTKFRLSNNQTVALGGKIDRVDRKESRVRIIDYKTGGDESEFKSVASLFDRANAKRNKAAFQAMMYAWVYARRVSGEYVLQPGLLNRKEIFKKDFTYGLKMDGQLVDDAHPFLEEFEEQLKQLLAELFDTQTPFDQTEDVNKCRYCSFKGICSR